jgi:hypothetical protein
MSSAAAEEIICVMRHASENPHGWRLRAMIVMILTHRTPLRE